MKAGKRDRRIRIEQKSVTRDPDYNTEVIAWVPFRAQVWAEVQDVLPSRGESPADGIRIATRPARVRIPYIDGITSDMRIVLLGRGDRVMKIVSQPAEMGRKEAMEFMVEEFTTAGEGA